jgi:Tol biopolymer transport system component
MRRATTVVVCAVLALGLAPGLAGRAEAAWPSGNGRIAFRSDRGSSPDVFSFDPGTGEVTNLTATELERERQPAWSPDGSLIAFTRASREGAPPDLFVMNPDGTGRRRLTRTKVAERDPAWSPDGTQIAFVSDRDGGFPELYVIGADGTGLRRITANAVIDGNPSWSPDGTRIAVERCCADGASEIYLIDLTTGLETDLTNTPDVHELDPVWSPDGTQIAFVALPVGDANIDIWLMGVDGSGRTRLTTHPAPDLAPAWQPLPICTITGSGSADVLVGTDGDDVICGLGGRDTVLAGAGNDLILGGGGADALDGQDGRDLVRGEGGDDTLDGGPGYDGLDGGSGTDTCLAGEDGAFLRRCENPPP